MFSSWLRSTCNLSEASTIVRTTRQRQQRDGRWGERMPWERRKICGGSGRASKIAKTWQIRTQEQDLRWHVRKGISTNFTYTVHRKPKDASKKRKFLLCMCPCYVDTYIEFVCTNIHSTALLISYFLTVRKCGIFCRLHLGSASCVSLTHSASSGERNFFLNENYKLRHDILRAESSEFFIYPVWKLFSPPLRTDFFSFCHIHDEKKCANAGNKK